MTWSEFHSESERIAAAAHVELRRGRSVAAQSLFAKAAEAETKALSALDKDKPRTYAITVVSAAALWFKAGDYSKAELLARNAIDSESLPGFAVEQLKDLLRSIQGTTSGLRPQNMLSRATQNLRNALSSRDLVEVFAAVGAILSALRVRRTSTAEQLVPGSQPAAVEPFWAEERLTVSKHAAVDLDETHFVSGLVALRRELGDLVEQVSEDSNIDDRVRRYLDALANRIPNELPDQMELFRLGHSSQVLSGFSSVVEAEWPDILAAQYRAVSTTLDYTLRQSPIWREFKRNASQLTLTSDQIVAANLITTEVAKALRENEASEFVDPAIPESLERLSHIPQIDVFDQRRPSEITDSDKQLLAIDQIESVNNTLKAIVERANRSAREMVDRRVSAWIARMAAASSASTAGTHFIILLINKYPAPFQWLANFISRLQ
jgi:hypothetical protein